MFCFDTYKQSLQSCCWGRETEGERPGLSGLQLHDDHGRNMWRFPTFHLSIGLKAELSGRFLCITTIQTLQPSHCCFVFQAKHNICDSVGGFRRRRTMIDERLRCRRMSDVELILFSTKNCSFFPLADVVGRDLVYSPHISAWIRCFWSCRWVLPHTFCFHLTRNPGNRFWECFASFGTTEDGLFLQERCSWGEFWHVRDEYLTLTILFLAELLPALFAGFIRFSSRPDIIRSAWES